MMNTSVVKNQKDLWMKRKRKAIGADALAIDRKKYSLEKTCEVLTKNF